MHGDCPGGPSSPAAACPCRNAACSNDLHGPLDSRTHGGPGPLCAAIRRHGGRGGRALPGQEYRLAYQSQATDTPFAWLQPDINDAIQQAAAAGYEAVVVAPIGFLCDHVEVLYDLDVQARQTAQECGVQFARAATVGNHPIFLDMLSTLLAQRLRE